MNQKKVLHTEFSKERLRLPVPKLSSVDWLIHSFSIGCP